MLPLALSLAAGDQQITAPELERDGAPPAFWPQQEAARLAERDEHHHGFLDRCVDLVRMPGHAVAAVAIEVEPDRVEHDSVAARQAEAHLLQHAGLERHGGAQAP